jgi:hypothetical protein
MIFQHPFEMALQLVKIAQNDRSDKKSIIKADKLGVCLRVLKTST